MTPLQEEFLELVETLLTWVSADQVYRNIEDTVAGQKVCIEDTGTTVVVRTDLGVLVDMERSPKGNRFYTWKKDKIISLTPALRQHYILNMLVSATV